MHIFQALQNRYHNKPYLYLNFQYLPNMIFFYHSLQNPIKKMYPHNNNEDSKLDHYLLYKYHIWVAHPLIVVAISTLPLISSSTYIQTFVSIYAVNKVSTKTNTL